MMGATPFSPLGPLRFEWGFPLAPLPYEGSSDFAFTIGSFFSLHSRCVPWLRSNMSQCSPGAISASRNTYGSTPSLMPRISSQSA